MIYDVEPLHSSKAKRYSVKVILKEPFSFDEIADISIEIKEKFVIKKFILMKITKPLVKSTC